MNSPKKIFKAFKFDSYNFSLLALGLIFFGVVAMPFMGYIPTGRDWIRYWLPHFEYYNQNGFTWGVLWQEGGGTLPIFDPSSLQFDPLYFIFNKILPFPLCCNVYLALYWLISLISAHGLLKHFQLRPALCFIFAFAYGFNGLAVSVSTQQFLPIYFSVAIFGYCFINLIKKQNVLNWFFCILSTYYFGYTAIPFLFITLMLLLFFCLEEKKYRLLLIKNLSIAGIFLMVPWVALLSAGYFKYAPDPTLLRWNFRFPRIIHFLFPEFINYVANENLWMDNGFGNKDYSQGYLSTIFLPFVTLISVGSFSSTVFSKNKVMKKILFSVLFLFLLASLGSLSPSLNAYLIKIPFYYGRYHEKYILGMVPIFLFYSSLILHKSDTQTLRSYGLKSLLFFCSLTLILLFNYPFFKYALIHYSLLVSALLFFQLIFLALGQLKFFSRKVSDSFLILSLFCSLPIFLSNFWNELLPISRLAEKEPDVLMGQHFGKTLERSFVYYDEFGTLPGCMAKLQYLGDKAKEKCTNYMNGGWLPLSFYSPSGYTSFPPLKSPAYMIFPKEEIYINFKSDFIITDTTYEARKFCFDLISKQKTIMSCEKVSNPDYPGPLQVFKLKHANELKVLNPGDDHRIDIKVKARFDKVRVPFIVPPKGNVLVDDKPVSHTRDEFGTIVNLGEVDKTKGYSEHTVSIIYKSWVTNLGLMLSAAWALILVAAHFILKKCFPKFYAAF